MIYGYLSGLFFLTLFSFNETGPVEVKIFHILDQEVRVTSEVPGKFIGKYTGRKEGFLILNTDGSGEYRYDIAGISGIDCNGSSIEMEWGFLVDENQQIIRFRRDYGYSYPVLYICTTGNCFQGCRKSYLLDYILEKDGDILTISSSDDWVK